MPVIFPATAESYIPSSLTLLSSKVTLCHFNMSSLTLLSSPEISDSRFATLLFRRQSAHFKIENRHSRTPNSAQPMMLLPPRIPSVEWAAIARVAPSNTRYFIFWRFFFWFFKKNTTSEPRFGSSGLSTALMIMPRRPDAICDYLLIYLQRCFWQIVRLWLFCGYSDQVALQVRHWYQYRYFASKKSESCGWKKI